MKLNQTSSRDLANGICVEVGVWEGEFTEQILLKSNVTKVFCVDPYNHFVNNEYPDGMNDISQKEFDGVFSKTYNKLTSRFGDRVVFIRDVSVNASVQFADESVDFVYIDGNHDYKYVLEDLKSWYPKVKSGGFLCGDDVYSSDLSEHDSDGNVTRIWSDKFWGKYGTYKALVDFGKKFEVTENQFKIIK